MNINRKREAGKLLGRAGISAEILKICEEVAKSGSYKDAINAAGKISVLFDSATCDEYWREKSNHGKHQQEEFFEYMLQTIEQGGSRTVCY